MWHAVLVTGVLCAGMLPAALGQYIQNDQYYVGDDGSVHVVGEVVNDLDLPLAGVSVQVTLVDGDGNPIFADETDSLVNTIMPSMKGPFDLVLAAEDQVPEVRDGEKISYVLGLDYDFATPKNQVIDITESELSRDRHGNLIVAGTVTNRGEITANMISVVTTLYDNQDNVAAVALVHPKPDYLRAGESAFFVVTVPDKMHVAEIGRYAAVAESEEYAAVPEFPVGTIVLLVAMFVIYVAVTRLVRVPMIGLISAADARRA